MASLGSDNHQRSNSGGYFFDGEPDTSINSNSAEPGDVQHEYSTLANHCEPASRPIRTVWAIILEVFTLVVLEILVFVLPYICDKDYCALSAYSTIVYVHALVWMVTLLLDRYLRFQHNVSRRNGYLEFYRQTRHVRRTPFLVISGGNAVLSILMAVLGEVCPGKEQCSDIGIRRCNYLQILVSLESVLILPFLLWYLVMTIKFNLRASVPDACVDDGVNSYLLAHGHGQEVGFRDEDYLDDVLEKQADMIRYLRQHNANLGRKIVKLMTELNAKR